MNYIRYFLPLQPCGDYNNRERINKFMMHGGKVNLWGVERADLTQNYIWANDPEVIKLTGTYPTPKTMWDMEKWLESVTLDPSHQTFAIKLHDGTYIGNIELSNIETKNSRAELGIFIGDNSHRGKGYGTEAIELMLRFGFDEVNLHRIYVKVLPFNFRALKCFEKCGFIHEGVEREAFYTWGKYWDVKIMGMLKGEFHEKYSRDNPQ